jgi:anaerobic selenocysteine-containing dehydrogenase
MQKLTRRNFLTLSAVGAAGAGLMASGLVPAQAAHGMQLRKKIGESYTICPYCSCGCGLIIATNEEGHITNSEGDPDNIVNRGALDPKSIAIRQLSNSPLRLHSVKYRAPGSSAWVEKSWDWAVSEIAQRIKKTRDENWVASVKVDDKDVAVNRTEGLAWLGGAANNNEDCYLSTKLARSLGVVYLEHQARI